MGYTPRALLAGGLGFAVSFLVACGGGSGLLSGDQATSLNSQLDQASSALDAGQCGAAANAIAGFQNAVDNLPASVNGTLVNNLRQGASTIASLSTRSCRSQTASTSTTSSSTTTSTTSISPSSTPSSVTSTTAPPTITSATTATGSGNNSTTSGSGGAGLGGGNGGGTGGAGTGNGNGNGNGQ